MKAQTRGKRGRRWVEHQTVIPKKWSECLKVDDNKQTDLFAFLSTEFINLPTDQQVISTFEKHVVCNHDKRKDGLAPCSHEEADSSMLVHVADAAK